MSPVLSQMIRYSAESFSLNNSKFIGNRISKVINPIFGSRAPKFRMMIDYEMDSSYH
jgi:hypothetical protein